MIDEKILKEIDERLTLNNFNNAHINANKEDEGYDPYNPNASIRYMEGENVEIQRLTKDYVTAYNHTLEEVIHIDIDTFKKDFDIFI